MGYGYTSDKLERTGFIDKAKILQYVSEEEIFKMVFGYLPREFEYVTSPFRDDENPGCWFERREGTLRFVDFGANNNMFQDCFGSIQIYYDLPNFYATLKFVYEHLIKGKNLVPLRHRKKEKKEKKDRPEIKIQGRRFISSDAKIWEPYGISKENLISDKVFPVSRYLMTNTKSGDVDVVVNTHCYAYTEFEENRKKLYFPLSNKRFITNCIIDDIGSINHLPIYGKQLIITKAYKDCRILRNCNRPSVWFGSEGIVPSLPLLYRLVSRFDRCIVFYDNDRQGIKSAIELSDIINSQYPRKSRPLWLPENLNSQGITDTGDLYKSKGKEELFSFFQQKLI